VTYRYPKFLFHYSVLSHSSYGLNGDVGAARFGSYGMQFHGTKGTLFIDRGGLPHHAPDHPPRGAEPAAALPHHRQPPAGLLLHHRDPARASDSSQQHGPHVRNFLDCVKSRKRPNADIEAAMHTNTVCRLGNIAYRVGRSLRWDAARQQIVGDAQASKLAWDLSFALETQGSVRTNVREWHLSVLLVLAGAGRCGQAQSGAAAGRTSAPSPSGS
jgi:hypothetical protein